MRTERIIGGFFEVVDLYVYSGETHGRVLAPLESSPTGYTSMTGAFETADEAIDLLVDAYSSGTMHWPGAALRFYELGARDLLRQALIVRHRLPAQPVVERATH